MTTVKIKTPKHLGPAVRRLGKSVDREIVRGVRKAARFGVREVVRTGLTTRPRPHASGTYNRSWRAVPVPDGATLSNTAEHSVFVERGRRAGRMPPVKAIIDWIEVKKLAAKFGDVGIRAAAFKIARKIARRGTKGRFVLERTMPAIDAEVKRQILAALQRSIRRQ